MRAYDYNEENDDEDDTAASIHPEVTPRLNTVISHACGRFTFDAFPDSGGCMTMIATDLAKKEDIEINYNVQTPKFVAVNGAELRIEGVASVNIENTSNGMVKSMAIIVSPDMKNDLILGYPQLKELGLISKKFPIASYINNTNEFENLKKLICNEYLDTIHDSLPEKQ